MSEGGSSLNVITQNLPYTSTICIFGFHKNAKIYNLHKKVENLQFSSQSQNYIYKFTPETGL